MWTRVESGIENTKSRGSTDLSNPYTNLLAFRGNVLDTNIVVCWVMLFPVPERVLPHEDPPDNQRNNTANEVAPGDDTPGDIVPWPVFSLPHERTDGVSDAITNQEDRVGRNSFSMACRDGGGPSKDKDKPGQTDINCPDRKQKPNLVAPW